MKEKSVNKILKEKSIGEIINPRMITGTPEMPVRFAVKTMQEHGSGYIILVKNRKAVGVFTENDLLFKILGKNIDWSLPVSEYMTKDPFVLSPNDPIGKAIDLMGEHRFYHIPLVDEKGELFNVLSVRTLIRFLAAFYPTEVYNLPPKFDQVTETAEGG